MRDYMLNFTFAFVIVVAAFVAAAGAGIVTGKLAFIYGPGVIFAALALLVAIAAGVGFANDEMRKSNAT